MLRSMLTLSSLALPQNIVFHLTLANYSETYFGGTRFNQDCVASSGVVEVYV